MCTAMFKSSKLEENPIDKRVACGFGLFEFESNGILYFRITNNCPTVEDAREFNTILRQLLSISTGQVCFIIDASSLGKVLSSDVRAELGLAAKAMEEDFRDVIVPSAYVVVTNQIASITLKIMNVFFKINVPQVVCRSVYEAQLLACKELKNNSLALA